MNEVETKRLMELRQTKRRRGNMLKLIRQTHEGQLPRMDDTDIWGWMQDLGSHMSQKQVMTMLQDLQVLGLIAFEQRFDYEKECYVAEKLTLTAAGTGLVTRRQNTEEVIFN